MMYVILKFIEKPPFDLACGQQVNVRQKIHHVTKFGESVTTEEILVDVDTEPKPRGIHFKAEAIPAKVVATSDEWSSLVKTVSASRINGKHETNGFRGSLLRRNSFANDVILPDESFGDEVSSRSNKRIKVEAFSDSDLSSECRLLPDTDDEEPSVDHEYLMAEHEKVKRENYELRHRIQELENMQIVQSQLNTSIKLVQDLKMLVQFHMPQDEEPSPPTISSVDFPPEKQRAPGIPLRHPHLRHTPEDEGVVELYPGASVYIKETPFIHVQLHSRSATSLARNLMDLIFTDDSLRTCSLKGGMPKGPRGKPFFRREAIYPAALHCLIDFVLRFARDKGWKESESDIVRALGTKLSERRKELNNLVISCGESNLTEYLY